MEMSPDATRSLMLSTRLYQALLLVYPSEFRKDYGGPMLQVFRDRGIRALREGGNTGLLSLWVRTMLDTVQTALEEHAQRGVDMSKEKLIRSSGWALMLGPLLFFTGAWANGRPPYSPYDPVSLPIDRYADQAAAPLVVTGLLFLTLGMLGMLLRFAPRWDGPGILLGLGALSGAVSTIGAAMLAVKDGSPWWEMFFLGMVAQFTALAVFGVIDMRRRLLPRWNGLPVFALWLPAVAGLSLGLVSWEISFQLFTGLWVLTCAMFAGLGYLLQSRAQAARLTAATA